MLTTVLLLAACSGSDPSSEPIPEPAAGTLSVVFGSRGEGEIEPCG